MVKSIDSGTIAWNSSLTTYQLCFLQQIIKLLGALATKYIKWGQSWYQSHWIVVMIE